jgi:hypothetical protein
MNTDTDFQELRAAALEQNWIRTRLVALRSSPDQDADRQRIEELAERVEALKERIVRRAAQA